MLIKMWEERNVPLLPLKKATINLGGG